MMLAVTNSFPCVAKGSRVLITGASGGIGLALVKKLLLQKGLCLGAHYATQDNKLSSLVKKHKTLKLFKKNFLSEKDCTGLVDAFLKFSGGIDALVVCSGGMAKCVHWNNLKERDWESDLFLNLTAPFFLARAAMRHMKSGGRIILFGTESALHGGGAKSLAYGIAKSAVECLVKGLAREGAKNNILVNMIRPGFISSGFHQRWQHKTKKDLKARAELVPLKRAGTPEEVAALAAYLLSDWAGFITGQSLAVTGGDWL